MTEKLYYADSHLHVFTARVTGCEETEKGWAVTLDRTAFFPEGGGQAADTGAVGPARVLDVQERAGEILHYTATPLEPGTEYPCALDWEQRLRRMQNHTGEHIVSGHVHRLYGLNNVGFHMGQRCLTVDFDGVLSWEQLLEIERLANETVRADLPVTARFPAPEELAGLCYRSKLELTENVRLVEIQGIDLCACCAPHVARTGEVGLVKLLDAQKHRGGIRVELLCGMDACEEVRLRQEQVAEISRLLSAKRDETPQAVQRLLEERDRQKERAAALSQRLAEQTAAAFEEREGNFCVFEELLEENGVRELVNLLSEKCSGLAAAFFPDGEGWRYIIGSRQLDLRKLTREINAGIGGRGGGQPSMIQGRAEKSREEIEKFIYSIPFRQK